MARCEVVEWMMDAILNEFLNEYLNLMLVPKPHPKLSPALKPMKEQHRITTVQQLRTSGTPLTTVTKHSLPRNIPSLTFASSKPKPRFHSR